MGLYIGNNKYKVMIGNQKCSFVTEDKVLPYDAEIEYLESSGTQYIDTGIAAARHLDIEIHFNIQQNPCFFFGSRVIVSNATTQALWYGNMDNRSLFLYGNSISGNLLPTISLNLWHVAKIIDVYYYLDDVLTYSYPVRLSIENGTNLYLFGTQEKNAEPNIKYSYVKISKLCIISNSNLLLDLIPVRIGTIGYMYDKVSGQLFGNAGTGNFILGPDK